MYIQKLIIKIASFDLIAFYVLQCMLQPDGGVCVKCLCGHVEGVSVATDPGCLWSVTQLLQSAANEGS